MNIDLKNCQKKHKTKMSEEKRTYKRKRESASDLLMKASTLTHQLIKGLPPRERETYHFTLVSLLKDTPDELLQVLKYLRENDVLDLTVCACSFNLLGHIVHNNLLNAEMSAFLQLVFKDAPGACLSLKLPGAERLRQRI